MSVVSQFYGLTVSMSWQDHEPPHVSVTYEKFSAQIDVIQLKVMSGRLPRRGLNLALDWIELHRIQLLKNWQLVHTGQRLIPIDPLL